MINAETSVPRLLTVEDLAALMGWSKHTIYQRRYRGMSLPPSIVIDQTIRFRAEDVDAWLTSHTTPESSTGGTSRVS
jgi:predicted DNA-binding transcriptional regulator AlpA